MFDRGIQEITTVRRFACEKNFFGISIIPKTVSGADDKTVSSFGDYLFI